MTLGLLYSTYKIQPTITSVQVDTVISYYCIYYEYYLNRRYVKFGQPFGHTLSTYLFGRLKHQTF